MDVPKDPVRVDGRRFALTPIRLFKVLMLVLAVVLIFHFQLVDLNAVAELVLHPWAMTFSVLSVVVAAQFNILRWYLLLRLQGCAVRFVRVWQISHIAYFVGTFTPAAVGGDALRVFYVNRECRDVRANAFLTIVFDRVLGLSGLLALALLLSLVDLGTILAQPVLAGLFWICLATVAGVLLALPLSAWLHRAVFPHLVLLPASVRSLADTVLAAMETYRRFVGMTAFCLVLSVVTHLFMAVSMVIVARAFGIVSLDVVELALASNFAILANHVPLTPGGLGIGEASFENLCRLLNPADAAVGYGGVVFASRLVTILSALPAIPALLTYRYRDQAAANTSAMAASTESTSSSPSAG